MAHEQKTRSAEETTRTVIDSFNQSLRLWMSLICTASDEQRDTRVEIGKTS